MKLFLQPVITVAAALVVLGAAIFTFAQSKKTERVAAEPEAKSSGSTKQNQRPADEVSARAQLQPNTGDISKYSYEFTQPQFYIRHILIQHDSAGHGTITFERLNEDAPLVEPVELSTAAVARILPLWQDLHFLESQENYQADKQFPHLGIMRLGMEQGAHKRTAEFNWTHNQSVSALVNEYRRVADQATFIFDISVARENQPLNAPKLMEGLESLLKRNGLSDPEQLKPLLSEISTDERLPLIARNHAIRLLKQIEKASR